MDAPSVQLRMLLTDLQLVTQSQWRECRPVVKAFARDLPAFDSVWVDALVQIKALTLFQAERIAARGGSELVTGDYLLIDQLRRDECLTTYLARHRATGEKVHLTRIPVSCTLGESADFAGRLASFVNACRQSRERSSLLRHLPTDAYIAGEAAWFVAPLISGNSAASLLVRRGRFPADVVEAIAAQLLRQLRASQELGLPHGDLRAAQVYISPRGRVTLHGHGMLATLVPEITMHHTVPIDLLDGLAPERIRQPQPVTAESELYAAGCVLWQLLAGRPAHLSADPLDKRVCHLRHRIPDVREIAPDTSPTLATLIQAMTEPDPGQRRKAVDEVISRQSFTTGEARLAKFLQQFETASPRVVAKRVDLRPQQNSSALGTLATATLLALTVSAGIVVRPYVQEYLRKDAAVATHSEGNSAVPSPVQAASGTGGVVTASLEAQTPVVDPNIVHPLPTPDASGVILLQAGRKYRAGQVTSAGEVIIRSPGVATLLVDESPLVVTSQSLKLEGIDFPVAPSHELASNPSLQVRAKTLTIERCQFRSLAAKGASPSDVLIRWSGGDPSDPSATRLRISDAAFMQIGTALAVETPLMGALLENVVKTGPGAVMDVGAGIGSGYRVPVVLDRTTLRGSGPLMRVPMQIWSQSGELQLSGEDSALATDREAPLLLLTGSLLDPEWHQHVSVAAQGIVRHPRTPFAAFQGDSGPSEARIVSPIDSSAVEIDGLLTDDFTFAGESLSDPVDCVAIANANPFRIAGSPFGAILQSFTEASSRETRLPVAAPPETSPSVAPRAFPAYNDVLQ